MNYTIDPERLAAIEKICAERYYIEKSDGTLENWHDLCVRVGTTLEPQAPFNEKLYSKDYIISALENREIMFGSPTLMNAGARLGMLSSCFIFEVNDDLDDILEVVKKSGLTFKHGGGIGYDWSNLRPEGDVVNSTGGTSSGPLSFMRLIDTAGGVVKGGGLRKAAIMSTMRVEHPDIEKFINEKRDETKLTNMNLSVTVTDEFMDAVKLDTDFNLRFPVDGGRVYRTVRARHIWNQMVDASWRSAEPGIIFIDRVNEYNTTPSYGPITHPNPCSEFFQVHWNSCNLGSVNLMSCWHEESRSFDYLKLTKLTRALTCALNKTIQVNKFPTADIHRVTHALKPIGIGVFGVANLFIKMGLKYGSEASCKVLEEILDCINYESLDISADYSKVFGPFDGFDYSNFRYLHEREGIRKWDILIAKIKKQGLYNCLTTTFMPTGTVSILAGQEESNGVEPLYSRKVVRKYVSKAGELVNMEVWATAIEEWYKKNGEDSILPDYIVTKDDLTPADHIKILSAAQKHCQTGVSKTVNFPNSATREDISDSMILAYSMQCKSVSVYRDGSRSVQILNSEASKATIKTVDFPVGYHSTTVPEGQKVVFSIQTNVTGKLLGVLPKTEAGELLTAGSEAATCNIINVALRTGADSDSILASIKDAAEWNGDMNTALYRALYSALYNEEFNVAEAAKELEATPEFRSCPTGVCAV